MKYLPPLITALFVCLAPLAHSQSCVVINEVLINASGQCDGSCTPATSEWVELYNNCPEPVDLSCFVMTDGDWALTFPEGTIIEGNAHFVLGSPNSGVAINLDWSTCGCTSGASNQVGIFTNGNEQLALVNGSGEFEDGVYWGTGQFAATPSFTSDPIGTCPSITIPLSSDNPVFTELPSQSSGSQDGFTLFRSCDGADTWLSGGTPPTPGTTNGTGAAPFTDVIVSQQNICIGTCIDFTPTVTTGIDNYNWSFEGADTPVSSEVFPTGICYPTAGSYQVEVTVINACGSQTITYDNFIQVTDGLQPVIQAAGPTSLCNGNTVQLSTDAVGSYQWLESGVEIPGATSASLEVNVAGIYSVNVVDGSCAGTSNTLEVTVGNNLSPQLSIAAGTDLCPNEIGILTTGEGFDTYAWYRDGVLLEGETAATLDVTNAPGVYSVDVTAAGCSGSGGPITITLYPPVVVDLIVSGPLSFCPGESVTLTAPQGLLFYTWTKDDVILPTPTGNEITIFEGGTYQLNVADNNGCAASSDDITVSVFETPVVTLVADPDPIICPDASATLNATPGYVSYAWTFSNEPLAEVTTDNYETSLAGIYSVTVLDGNGCEGSSNQLLVNIAPVPLVQIVNGDTATSCFGSALLQLTVTNNVQSTYQWFNSNGSAIGGATSVNYTANTAGSYFVQATSAEGCVGESALVVVELFTPDPPFISFTGEQVCEGTPVDLVIEEGYTNVVWSDGTEGPSLTIDEDGLYGVSATDSNGCSVSAQRQISFLPLPNVDAGEDGLSDCTVGVTLNGTAQGSVQWSPSEGLSSPESLQTQAVPLVNTVYTLTATLNGCTNSDFVFVEAKCPFVLVPNVFTPNNDGLNATFRVNSFGVDAFEMKIYNRWGQLLFESDSVDRGWSGDEATEGTYFWTVKASDKLGRPINGNNGQSGTLTLIRKSN